MPGHETSVTAGTAGYEYLAVEAPRNERAFMLDTYAAFGWEPDGTAERSSGRIGLRRRRDLPNRAAAVPLQAACSEAIREIHRIRRGTARRPRLVAIAVAVAGAAAFAGAVFALDAGLPELTWTLGAAGALLELLAYPMLVLVRRRRAAASSGALARQRDIVDRACGRAARLLT